MASVVISEGIILIASVLVAIAISGIIVAKIGVFESSFTAQSNAQQDLMLTKIKVVYATNEDSNTVNIWVKNIGNKPISQMDSVDIYFGELDAVDKIGYNVGSSPEWTYSAGLPTVWNTMETLQIDVDISGTLQTDTTHMVRVATPNGVIDDYIFTIL